VASHPRYEIVNTIAAGDFATVFRARDRALGREVAIKQIHPQFLGDPRQLARYWQEAQLLATLQHPNILTIYDIDRPMGWLILELMHGSVKQLAAGQPLDLDFLRGVLHCSLNALHFLHGNGVIHGDLKPSNLLLDSQYRVKLGDFGLARRAVSDEGSLLKGTTKYMAPELVSDQFGPVGPASDLYSLGFAAYELMCGEQFEALFPGLSTFGRDRQIAWMMWHAAADRNIPEINRTLQGVPPDLAHVIQRLVIKDQARRYRSAAEALADLRGTSASVSVPPKPPAVDDAPRIRRRRLITVAAGLFIGMMLTVAAIVMLPGSPKKSGPAGAIEPTRGVVREILPEEQKFVLETSDGGKRLPVTLKYKDRIFINHKETRVFRDLRSGDRVTLHILRDDTKGTITEVHASRPHTRKGRVSSVKPDEGLFTLSVTEGDDQGKSRRISVPPNLKIRFNGRDDITQRHRPRPDAEEKVVTRPVRLDDLQLDDRVVVADYESDTGPVATEMSVERVIAMQGIVRQIDTHDRTIVFALGEDENSPMTTLPYALNCIVTINDRKILDGKALGPADLKPGDKAERIARDSEVQEVNVRRILGQAGALERLDYAARRIDVRMPNSDKVATYQVEPDCRISLSGESTELDDLRAGDLVDVTLDQPDARVPLARAISVRRPVDPNRWAVLIGVDQYDDSSASPLTTATADARRLFDILTRRYSVSPEQALLLANEQTLLVRLQQAIPNLLGRVTPESQVIVYFAGHAYRNDEGQVFLAPKDFQLAKIAQTCLPLQWLADQLEQCPAKDKLLILDSCHAGEGADLKHEPSTTEMLKTVKGPPGFAPFRTITALASCQAGQRGATLPQRDDGKQHGLFAACLAECYAGRGDVNRDGRIEPTELFAVLKKAMVDTGAPAKLTQTPELFLPDARPPRLSEDGKKAVRKLASLMRHKDFDMVSVQTLYDEALAAAGAQPEPKLLRGLLLMKAKRRDEALRTFQDINAESPQLVLPSQAAAWLQFERLSYQAAVDELNHVVSKIPASKPTEPLAQPVLLLFNWVGQLREFASIAAVGARRLNQDTLATLDKAVESYGPDALLAYTQGRDKTKATAANFERVANSSSEIAAAKARVERRQLANYVAFPFDEIVQSILTGLDR
jgi:serine/threonine-protein kinase